MFKYICIYNIVHIFEYMRGNMCNRICTIVLYIYPNMYTHRYIQYNFCKCDIIYNYISVSILILNNKTIIGIYRYL